MKTVCELCGKYSSDSKQCTNCGSEIITSKEIPTENFNTQYWGWATFSFSTNNLIKKENIINHLRDKWIELEKFTIFHLFNSQISKFNKEAEKIRVLARKDFLSNIINNNYLKSEGLIIDFEPLDIVFKTAEETNKFLEANSKNFYLD